MVHNTPEQERVTRAARAAELKVAGPFPAANRKWQIIDGQGYAVDNYPTRRAAREGLTFVRKQIIQYGEYITRTA
jgi:hypothetical protein